jgi:hypothetical protein
VGPLVYNTWANAGATVAAQSRETARDARIALFMLGLRWSQIGLGERRAIQWPMGWVSFQSVIRVEDRFAQFFAGLVAGKFLFGVEGRARCLCVRAGRSLCG